jgi:hypothetical protein
MDDNDVSSRVEDGIEYTGIHQQKLELPPVDEGLIMTQTTFFGLPISTTYGKRKGAALDYYNKVTQAAQDTEGLKLPPVDERLIFNTF